jgi:hypothetical protein
MANKKKNILEFKTISNEKIGGKQLKCIQVNRIDKQTINKEQVENLYNDLITKGLNKNKIMIRGLNNMRYTTLKGKNQENIDFDDDYYVNKNINKSSFENYFQLQFYIFS